MLIGDIAGIITTRFPFIIIIIHSTHVWDIKITENLIEILQDIVAYPPPVGLVVLIGTTP